MYHFFGGPRTDPDVEGLFITADQFGAHLSHLEQAGWTPLDLTAYLAALDGAPVPRKSFLLTIDDGHESVVRIAAPMLRRAGIPGILFLCPGLFGDSVCWSDGYHDEPLIGVADLRRLADASIEFGVHTVDHVRMEGLGQAALHRHVVEARTELEAATGEPARAFAYPFGAYDQAARTAVEEAGYDVAFAVAREGGRFAADRIYVRAGDGVWRFRFKLTLAYRAMARIGGRMPGLRRRVRAASRWVLRRDGRAPRRVVAGQEP